MTLTTRTPVTARIFATINVHKSQGEEKNGDHKRRHDAVANDGFGRVHKYTDIAENMAGRR